jgi:uncharacterized protein (TIGR03435 family)
LFPPKKERTTHTCTNIRMRELAAWLEEGNDKVILDETLLPGKYDFVLVEDPIKGIPLKNSLAEIGLQLQPAKRNVAAFYVEVINTAVPVKVDPLKEGYILNRSPTWFEQEAATQGHEE